MSEFKETEPMKLLPPAPGKCAVCAVEHTDGQPHDAQSLFYQMQFHGRFGRWPTWADAVAHCDEATKTAWEQGVRELGA